MKDLMRICAMSACWLLAAAVPAAELEAGLSRCAGVDSNLERLTCYDALAREHLPTAPAGEYGKWRLQMSKNPFDDSTTVLLILGSDSGTTPQGDPVSLILRCESGATDAYINWGTPLGQDETELRYRVGTGTDQKEDWQISTDGNATFYRGNARRFIEKLMKQPSFVAQVIPTNTIPIRAQFDLAGLAGAIEPLQRTCGW